MGQTTGSSTAFDRLGKEFTSWAARVAGYSSLLIGASEKLELFSRTLQSKGLDTALSDQIRSVKSILPDKDAVVFDVGANVGNWTRELLKSTGSSVAQVHCFEPIPTNVDAIRRLNDPRVIVHPIAVGARVEERKFYSDFTGSGIASLFERDTPDAPVMSVVETVAVRPLDDVIKSLELTRVDLVKMDIEGAEFDALHGALESIEGQIVRAFTFEIGSVNISSKTYLSDFFKFATSRGFKVYRLTAGGGLYEIEKYRVSQECFATTNYLATRTLPTN